MRKMFRSLATPNYRRWFAGALISNTGFWMQRTAQDWIVLTELTDQDAAAVGITMALQMVPLVLLLPISGFIADRVNGRRLLMITNSIMALLALGLGTIIVTGVVELWHVWVFAFVGGCVSAIENPVKQSFVSELVSRDDLPNAVSLNSASFNLARTIGPSVSALLTLLVGPGLVFFLNALTFVAILLALARLNRDQLHSRPHLSPGKGHISAGFRYVWSRPDIVIIMAMVFITGTFGLNFPIFSSTMTLSFGLGVAQYGLLLSSVAVGSVVGALLAALREKPRFPFVIAGCALFGIAMFVASMMPTYWSFAALLVAAGIAVQTILTTANGYVQVNSDPAMRGRVMAVYTTIFVGGTPIGAPIIGWVANQFGPRAAVGVGATAVFVAALIGLLFFVRSHRVRLRWTRSAPLRLAFTHDGSLAREELALDEGTAKRS